MTGVERESLMRNYVFNMKKYLKTFYTYVSDEELEHFIKDFISQNIQRPKARVIEYPSYGNAELKTVDLLTFIKKINDKVIAPSGTIYQSTDKGSPPIKIFLDDLVERRSKAKKEMFNYTVQGNMTAAILKNYEQALYKINQNSVIGAMGTEFSAMYDLESFNAVTSLARHGIIMAYAFAERFLANNHYFPDIERLLNYIIVLANAAPSKEIIDNLVAKYNLFIPTCMDISESLLESMQNYDPGCSQGWVITETIKNFAPHEQIYIFYAKNLYNLITCNSAFFKRWITDFMNTDKQVTVTEDIDPKKIFKIDEDLLCALTTIYDSYLNGMNISETPDLAPNAARLIVACATKMQQKLDDLNDLISTFLHGKEFIPAIPENRYIKRKCVAISDTDSVIYTDKHLVTWYLNGELRICQNGFNMHALVTYWMTKAMANLIKVMAKSRGAIGKNIDKIKMKNEFLYTVLIKTNLGKHYAGRIKIQEGRILPKPKLDIKGVSFKTSNLPKVTHDFTESILIDIIDEIEEHGNLYAGDYIHKALDYEKKLFDNINSGNLTYFGNVSIKPKEEYLDPESSIYFNYELWERIFEKKYGKIHIPGKYPLIPIISTKFKSIRYLDWLRMREEEIAIKLEHFFNDPKYKKKQITRLPLPITLTKIPEIFIPVINSRSIVYKNMAPCQLALRSLGIDLGNQKKMPLFSDIYPLPED